MAVEGLSPLRRDRGAVEVEVDGAGSTSTSGSSTFCLFVRRAAVTLAGSAGTTGLGSR